ncbi:MAG: hypothetical protein H6686_08830 [Fibrobacteria bacterium]|nr:hypothetical protein [Fibrobacteria bacterium]
MGTLPLAGGDPRHHPDLRDTTIDLMWGVPLADALDPGLDEKILRTWLTNRGCLDDRTFLVGWDQFLLPQTPGNHLSASDFPLDAHHLVHRPDWSTLSDAGLTLACLRALATHPGGGKPMLSDKTRLLRETSSRLSAPLVLTVQDAQGNPARHARMELWRARPESTRPYFSRFHGEATLLQPDTAGRIPLESPLALLAGNHPWQHGKDGSRGTAFWRISEAGHSLQGWIDAEGLLSLPDSLGILRWTLQLPAGTTQAWKEASQKWPSPWLAAQIDSAGDLWIGLSVPSPTSYVLRLIDPSGTELAHSRILEFTEGVWERRFRGMPTELDVDVRLDSPSSRLQVRPLRASRVVPSPGQNHADQP